MEKIIWTLKAGVNLPFAPKIQDTKPLEQKASLISKEHKALEEKPLAHELEMQAKTQVDAKNTDQNIDVKPLDNLTYQDAKAVDQKTQQLNNNVADSVNNSSDLKSHDSKPMRLINADLFIEYTETIDYIKSLIAFLQSKGLSVAAFDDRFSYKDSDIILALQKPDHCVSHFCQITQDKAPLWAFLKQIFAGKL